MGWGTKVIERLSKDLRVAFPDMKGFSLTNFYNMRRFAELYPDQAILQQAAGELPWYHHVILMERIIHQEERDFYTRHAAQYGWSRAILIHQIESRLYERQGQAVSNFEEKLLAPQSDLAQQTLKDPYIFDFLSVGKEAQEREIEQGLVAHMEKFLLELGDGFAFVGRQYHLKVGSKDFYIDLLFYHLKLRSFVVAEIKACEFEPKHVGQLNFYLSAVDDLLKHESDSPSIGLILCKTQDRVVAEYALRDVNKPIGLSEYRLEQSLPKEIQTSLPSIEELEAELKKGKVQV